MSLRFGGAAGLRGETPGGRGRVMLSLHRYGAVIHTHHMGTHPIDRWHAILARRDPAELDSLFADDVVFVSPVVHRPQQGRQLTTWYLAAAFKVFFNDTFRYVRQIIGPNDAMLEFETTIDGVLVNGVDIIRWNDDGKVVEFKVMVRPLKAINLIHERMAAMLQALQKP